MFIVMYGKCKFYIYIYVVFWYKGLDEENKSMFGDLDSMMIYK